MINLSNINWRRGLTRVWVIGSLCWAISVLLEMEIPTAVTKEEIFIMLGVIVLPPLAVLIAGHVLLPLLIRLASWLLAGFAEKPHR